MEIKSMIEDLKCKVASLSLETEKAKRVVDDMRRDLASYELLIRENTDTITAYKMAIDSLEMAGKPAEQKPEPVQTPSEPPCEIAKKEKVKAKERKEKERMKRDTTPKKVLRMDKYDNQIGVFWSISSCAKELNVDPATIRYRILNFDRDFQLKNFGYYLKYTA